MHAKNPDAMVMRNSDGTPMSKAEVIVMRRGAFKWMPVLCSNDLVHGSWWMVWGSVGCVVFAIVPLIEQYLTFFSAHDDTLPQLDFKLTWALLIFSGTFFTIGSIAFVRAFEEPPVRPLLYWYKHCQTDELLGAWLFLVGTIPAVPYTLVFFLVNPTNLTSLGALSSSGIFVIGSILFVVGCYPSDTKQENKNYVLPLMLRVFGAQMWIVKHLANDWLAGTWFFFWANLLFSVGAFFLLINAVANQQPKEAFVWLSSTSTSFLFLVGSAYFVAGSYPHASQFYYLHDKHGKKMKNRKKGVRDPNAKSNKGRKRRLKRPVPVLDLEAGEGMNTRNRDRNDRSDRSASPDIVSPLHALSSHTPMVAPARVAVASAEREELPFPHQRTRAPSPLASVDALMRVESGGGLVEDASGDGEAQLYAALEKDEEAEEEEKGEEEGEEQGPGAVQRAADDRSASAFEEVRLI